MTTLIVYYDSTGAIKQTVSVPDTGVADYVCPAGLSELSIEPSPLITKAYATANYVSAGAVVTRQTMTPTVSATSFAADGTTACIISGLPNPCSVSISGVLSAGPSAVTDGSIIITSTHAGDLTVAITADPAWLPWSTTIHAV